VIGGVEELVGDALLAGAQLDLDDGAVGGEARIGGAGGVDAAVEQGEAAEVGDEGGVDAEGDAHLAVQPGLTRWPGVAGISALLGEDPVAGVLEARWGAQLEGPAGALELDRAAALGDRGAAAAVA
jgi:hypothetical protein